MVKNREKTQQAIIELHRAIKALQVLEHEMADHEYMHRIKPSIRGKAKRASMDASRALIDFRGQVWK